MLELWPWMYNMYILLFPSCSPSGQCSCLYVHNKDDSSMKKKWELNSHAKFLTSTKAPKAHGKRDTHGNPLFMHQWRSFSVLFFILLKKTDFIILKKTSVWRSSHSFNMLAFFYSGLVRLQCAPRCIPEQFLLFRQKLYAFVWLPFGTCAVWLFCQI